MEGWMTFAGILIMVAGWALGTDTASDLTQINNQIVALIPDLFAVGGAVVAWYGRWRREKREE